MDCSSLGSYVFHMAVRQLSASVMNYENGNLKFKKKVLFILIKKSLLTN